MFTCPDAACVYDEIYYRTYQNIWETAFKVHLLQKAVYSYTERQKKLITSSERRSLKCTLSKFIIFGHRLALILLNENIWKNKCLLVSKRRKMLWNCKRTFFLNRRNCSPSKLHRGSLFRTFISYSFNFSGGLCNRHIVFFPLWTPGPGVKQFLWVLKTYLLRFHRIFIYVLLKQTICLGMLKRITIANLCPNMIHFDASDFTECRSEEVTCFFWCSV